MGEKPTEQEPEKSIEGQPSYMAVPDEKLSKKIEGQRRQAVLREFWEQYSTEQLERLLKDRDFLGMEPDHNELGGYDNFAESDHEKAVTDILAERKEKESEK